MSEIGEGGRGRWNREWMSAETNRKLVGWERRKCCYGDRLDGLCGVG